MKQIIISLLVVAVVLAILKPLVRLPHQVCIDYNEGWNAYFADRAVSGQQLYQPRDALVLNNYPPLSFYIVGAFGKVVGDTIIGGRILSLTGLLLSAVMLTVIVHCYTRSLIHGAIGGLLLVGYMGAYHSAYVGMNDPQWLAQGCMMTGLVAFLYRKVIRHGIAGAASIMLVAGFMKHNLIAIPAACTLWLWMYERESFRRWIVTGGVLLFIGFGVLYLSHGALAFVDIFSSPRTYRIGLFVWVGQWLQPAILYIVCALCLSLVDRSREIRLLLFAAVISLTFATIAVGGAGVDYNFVFEFISLIITLSMIGHDRLQLFVKGGQKELLCGVVALALPVLLVLPRQLYSTKNWIKDLPVIEATTQADIHLVAQVPGLVMCENLALAYWAGKPFSVDFFSVGQKIQAGKMDPAILASWIDRRGFALIQFEDQTGQNFRLPDTIVKKIRTGYQVKRTSAECGLFLVP